MGTATIDRDDRTHTGADSPPVDSPPADWARLVHRAPAGIAGMFLALMLVFGPSPDLLVFAGILLALAVVGWRFPRRIGPIVVLTGATAFILLNLQYVRDSLSHPETPLAFNTALIPVLLSTLGIVAAVGTLRSWTVSTRRATVPVAIVFVVGATLSMVATAGVEDDPLQAGDARISTARGLSFTPEEQTIRSGTGIYVENNSPARHTFTVDELGLDVELPAGTARRVVVRAEPGSYEFRCAVPGHEDMRGTLVVSG